MFREKEGKSENGWLSLALLPVHKVEVGRKECISFHMKGPMGIALPVKSPPNFPGLQNPQAGWERMGRMIPVLHTSFLPVSQAAQEVRKKHTAAS